MDCCCITFNFLDHTGDNGVFIFFSVGVTITLLGMITASKQTIYSFFSLFSLSFCEIVTIIGVHHQNPTMYCWGLFIMVVLCLFLIGVGWSHIRYPFWPNKKIFTKLMANAIAPSRLGGIYLLLFVVHLGWLTDGSLNYFLSSNDSLVGVNVSVITSILGMFELICFFPEGKKNKGKIRNKIFVSGISAIGFVPDSYANEKFSFTPLVKILQEADRGAIETNNKSGKCKMLILLSDYYTANKVINNKSLNERLDIVKRTIQKGDTNVTNEIFDSWSIEEQLRKLIKEVAKFHFSDSKEWINSHLEIEFTDPCDYDDYPTCFKTLSRKVEDMDISNDTEICFNLTPGTAPISSIVTLLSIDSKRKLYYYSQDISKSNEPIKPVDKTKVPLENLLSQALETLKES